MLSGDVVLSVLIEAGRGPGVHIVNPFAKHPLAKHYLAFPA
jgi:hypothetical protein